MSNEVIHPMAVNQQGFLLLCVYFLLRRPENSSSLQCFWILLKSCLHSQLPDPPLTSSTEIDPGGSQAGCPTHRTLATTRLCFSSNAYMRKMLLKKKIICNFILTCRDKPDIIDECYSQPGMKSIWWEQLPSLIFWALLLSKQLQLTSFASQACALTRQSHDSFRSFPVAWWIFNSFIKTGSASARRLVTASHFGD